jgi:putative Holliday junction resolvase
VVKDAAALARICEERQVDQIVVGLPLEQDGSEGRPVRLARQVAEELHRITGLPVDWEDERYSTMEAKERLREAGVPEALWKQTVDAQAAAVILEDWLERVRG